MTSHAIPVGLLLSLGLTAGALQPGKTARGRIAGGQTRSYSILLKAGEYLYVESAQQDVHLRLRLLAPSGQLAAEIRSSAGTSQQSVQLHDIVETAGKYRLEVIAEDPRFTSGTYDVRIVARRPVTAADRERTGAEHIYAAAVNEEAGTTDQLAKTVRVHEAVDALLKLNERKRLGEMALFEGETILRLKNYPIAQSRFELAAAAFYAVKDRRGEDFALMRLGANVANLNQFDRAFAALGQASKNRHDAGDVQGEAEALSEIGAVWLARDRYDKALENYSKSLDLYRSRRSRPLDVASALESIGQVYLNLSQFQMAADRLEEALALARKFPDPYLESYILLHLGEAYTGLAEAYPVASQASQRAYKKAADILGQARQLRPKKEDFTVFYSATVNTGLVYSKMGLYQWAIESLEPAIKMARMGHDPRIEGIAVTELATVHRIQPRYDEAIAGYERARTIFHEIQSPHLEALALAGLMRCWKGKGDTALAIVYGKQAVNLLQSVRSENRKLGKQMLESFLHANEEPYHDLAGLLIAAGRLAEAEQVINLLKQQEYRDYVRASGAPAGERTLYLSKDETEIVRREAEVVELGAKADAIRRNEPLTADDKKQAEALEERQRASAREYQAFLELLKREVRAGRVDAAVEQQLRNAVGLQTDLRKLSQQGGPVAAVYTLVTEKTFYAVLITPDQRTKFEYAIDATQLNKLVVDFRDVLQNPNLDPRPLGKRLYDIVMGQVGAKLAETGEKTIMWSLDGCLRYLPLAALYDGEKYAVERYRMAVFTPVSNSRFDARPSAKWQALGLGVTKPHGEAPALPEVESELEGIIGQSRAPGSAGAPGVLTGEIMFDEQFTERSMRQELKKGFPVVHIASHFQFEPGDESRSFLLMGDGSQYRISDLEVETRLFDNVELLTLSACNTGVALPGADGKEVESFGVEAQRQGAQAVVASLWSVADLSTSLMMRRFYQVRESHPEMTKLEALERAQIALLTGEIGGDIPPARRSLQHPLPAARTRASVEAPKFQTDPKAPYAHPYYWAAFYLMGNWL